jgi:16S rRNA (guanine(527)-N(7))-methyltransferase RsmG
MPIQNTEETLVQSLSHLCEREGLAIDGPVLGLLGEHFRELMKWNQAHNLTRIMGAQNAAAFHYYDSLHPLKLIEQEFPRWQSLLDVGTGAGFPGFIAALKYPEREVILLDASRKRCSFLRNTARLLGVSNIQVQHGRIEDSDAKADLVCSRATFRWTKQASKTKSEIDSAKFSHGLLDDLVGRVKPAGAIALWVGDAPSFEEWGSAVEHWRFHTPARWPYGIPLYGIPTDPHDSEDSAVATSGRALVFARKG